MSPRIAMVAGEPSGDLLAARVMRGLSQLAPGSVCEGIGGPAMAGQGLHMLHSMDALTVFGYVDALKRLPGLLRTYGDVKRRWMRNKPDVFVGVDAPDFNLRLEQQLRDAGVPTVHFVGPSIWAWRYERIHRIRSAVSHMLVLFPFEEALYQKEGVPVTYVGHPLAQVIPMVPDRDGIRRMLGLQPGERVLTVMPGSRTSEIKLLAPRFLQAVRILRGQDPDLRILVPMVNAQRRAQFEAILKQYPVDGLMMLDASVSGTRPAAWDALEAADAVLVASGTATLEAALFKRPMVISYVLSEAMRRIMAWKSGQSRPLVPWVGLPNVLLNDFAVPELLQEEATPEKLAEASWKSLTDTEYAQHTAARFTGMHETLLRDTPGLAAKAILSEARRGG